MKAFTICLVLIVAVASIPAKKATAQSTAPLAWMVGKWKIQTPGGVILEEWKNVDDTTLAGRSVFIRNNSDTSVQENVILSIRNGQWYYTPTVASQNNALPVPFKIIFLKGSEFIAENTAHDFPQRISYRRIQSQLFASIEGRKNGRYTKQNFDFVMIE
jgi:Domain of unknown function (DUF6265)